MVTVTSPHANTAPSIARRYQWRTANIDWWPWLVALSALMFTQLSQTKAVVVFVGFAIVCGLIRPDQVFSAATASRLFWPFLLFAAASIIWSQDRSHTARAVAELGFTVASAALVARALSPKSFVSLVAGTCLIGTVASVLFLGPELIRELTTGYPVRGIFLGSKNSFGAVQALLILAGIWMALDRKREAIRRLFALLCVGCGAVLLVASKSATAVGSLVPALVCSLAVFSVGRITPRGRAILLIATFLLTTAAIVALISIDSSVYMQFLEVSGRDASLTGRTTLWLWADRMIANNPILGVGYEAFWIQGNPYAEELWRLFAIRWRSGFHFHNQWYQIAVELGYTGLAIALATFVATCLRVASWAVRRPSPESCFFLGFVVMAAVRTYVEVDLFLQFALGFIILIVGHIHASKYRDGLKSPQRQWRGRRLSPGLFRRQPPRQANSTANILGA